MFTYDFTFLFCLFACISRFCGLVSQKSRCFFFSSSIFYCCYFQLLFESFASLNISLFLHAGRLHKLAWRVNAHSGQRLLFLFVMLTDPDQGRSRIWANTSPFLTQADHQNRRFRGLWIHKKNPAWLQKLSCYQPGLSWSSII